MIEDAPCSPADSAEERSPGLPLAFPIPLRLGILALLLVGSSGCGDDPTQEGAPPEFAPESLGVPEEVWSRLSPQQRGEHGRWRKLHGADAEIAERIKQLEAIGYVGGSRAAPEITGITVHDPKHVSAGWNFFTSGHEPGATLMDMDGNVRHQWRATYEEAFPEHPLETRNISCEFWRRARLFENGDVVAIYEGLGIVRVDRDSKVLWASRNGAHHDFDVTPSGELLVLTRIAHVVPRVSKRPILEDFVSILDPATGEERRRVSLLECFETAGKEHDWSAAYVEFWKKESTRRLSDTDPSDIFHTNAIERLDGAWAERIPEFRAGNLLLSMRNLDTIAVVDLERATVVWSLGGVFHLQHEPTVAVDGMILVFDNHWSPRTFSNVVAVDPAKKEPTWQYRGSPERPFYSHSCGSVASLPNGNVLITESDNGRALEVTPSQETVWEYWNPFRAGDHDEYIASIFEMVRIPRDFPLDWAEEPAG